MIVEKFARLPGWIDYQGINFELQLIVNGRPDDVRLVYAINYVSADSPHKALYEDCGSWINSFEGHCLQGFLFLVENIETDEDLITAIDECEAWLKEVALWES